MPLRLVAAGLLGIAALVIPEYDVEASGCEVVAQISADAKAGARGKGSSVSASIDARAACPSPDAPAPTDSDGEGGAAACRTRALGDLAQVEAVWAAVTAQQAPDPADPNFVEDISNPGGVSFDDVMFEAPWFRSRGGEYQILYGVTCPGSPEVARWVTVVPDSAGNLVPQVRAIDLVGSLHAEVVRRLPAPVVRVGPADEDANGWTYVQNRTFFWVDQGDGQWATVSGSTSAGGISVTVQAVPVRLVVNPGDGSPAVTCQGAPPAVTKAAYRPDIEGCSFVYRHSSATAPNGATFPLVASIVWHATWSASTGEGGDLGYLSTTSDVRDLAVAEIQALITDSNP